MLPGMGGLPRAVLPWLGVRRDPRDAPVPARRLALGALWQMRRGLLGGEDGSRPHPAALGRTASGARSRLPFRCGWRERAKADPSPAGCSPGEGGERWAGRSGRRSLCCAEHPEPAVSPACWDGLARAGGPLPAPLLTEAPRRASAGRGDRCPAAGRGLLGSLHPGLPLCPGVPETRRCRPGWKSCAAGGDACRGLPSWQPPRLLRIPAKGFSGF